MSTASKVVLGCGGFLLLCLVATCGIGGYFGWVAYEKVDAYAQEFVAKGYQRQSGQVIVVPGPVNERTVYTGQVVQIPGEVNADIAILAQVAEIKGEVNGDIDFTGQVLHIKPGATVKGDIRVGVAQVVKVEGIVEGKISGDYGSLLTATATSDEGVPSQAPAVPVPPVAPKPPVAPEASIAPEAPEAPAATQSD